MIPVGSPTGYAAYVTPVLAGLLIAAAGLIPWTLLAQVNARVRPDLPWAAVTALVYLAALVTWLNGSGPPRSTARQRRQRLRLWPRSTSEAGLFVASMLYGTLARRTGTIFPGVAIHIVGDLAHVYFGVLRGDGSLLFVT